MASDIFAKIGDIKGESVDTKHKDEIELLSWSWGVSRSASGSGGGAGAGTGKAHFNDLSFTHKIDKASPLLLKACATGQHLKEATITRRKAGKGQQEFLVIKMNDVLVTSFILMTRNSCCPLPAFRRVIVASFRCCPVAHAPAATGTPCRSCG